jgi:hypothetical protein
VGDTLEVFPIFANDIKVVSSVHMKFDCDTFMFSLPEPAFGALNQFNSTGASDDPALS